MCDDSEEPSDSQAPLADKPKSKSSVASTEESVGEEVVKEELKEEVSVKPEEDLPVDAGSAEMTCSLNMQANAFVSLKTGQKKRVACPPGCAQQPTATVFGPAEANDRLQLSEVFDEKSSFCRAAIHQGIIADSDGGDIYVLVQNGRDF